MGGDLLSSVMVQMNKVVNRYPKTTNATENNQCRQNNVYSGMRQISFREQIATYHSSGNNNMYIMYAIFRPLQSVQAESVLLEVE